MKNTRQIATAYRNAKKALNNFRANGGDRHSTEYMKLMANVEGFRNDCINALTITANFTKENASLVFAVKTNEILTLMHDYNKDLD